jgi:hypothetical protein
MIHFFLPELFCHRRVLGSHGASMEEIEAPVIAGEWMAGHFHGQRFRHR